MQGGSVQAGAWQEDTVREVYGSMSGRNSWIYVEGKGALATTGLPITFLHKFLPVVTAFFQDSTFAYLALFPPGQSRLRRMYGNLLSCILVKRHSFSPYV